MAHHYYHRHQPPHFYATTQAWPSFGRHLASTPAHPSPLAAVQTDSGDESDTTYDSAVNAAGDDSDTTDNTAETAAEPSEVDHPSSDQFWSCVACWNERSSSVDAECQFCEMTTETIKRWRSSKKPVVKVLEGYETTGDDIDTPWICVGCEETKLFLGGESSNDPIFKSYCAQCQQTTDTVYADRRSSYCCRSCRYERPKGAKGRNVRVGNTIIFANMWNRFCDRCGRLTDTIKLDPTAKKEWCCQHCRFARDPPEDEDEEEEDECEYCQRTTDTVEIDSMAP